jgi:hypothetical protein
MSAVSIPTPITRANRRTMACGTSMGACSKRFRRASRDRSGEALAYVYYQDEPLSRDEVRHVAAKIRKLLDLSRARGRALTIQRGPA